MRFRADEVGDLTQRIQPDVALVGVGHDVPHALQLIDAIVKESACPVIAILSAADDGFVREAAKLGVFAYIVDDDPSNVAEHDRDRPTSICRVSEPGGGIRATRRHRARKGDPDGTSQDS